MRDPSKLDALRREIAEIEARKVLNRAQVIAVLCDQAGGIQCGCGCGEPLDPLNEGVVDEHVIPLEQTGTNELHNRRFYRKPCATAKTRIDAGNTAKCRRLAGETCTAPGRPIPQHVNGLQARGFDRSKTRGFDGKVRPRKQGASQ